MFLLGPMSVLRLELEHCMLLQNGTHYSTIRTPVPLLVPSVSQEVVSACGRGRGRIVNRNAVLFGDANARVVQVGFREAREDGGEGNCARSSHGGESLQSLEE